MWTNGRHGSDCAKVFPHMRRFTPAILALLVATCGVARAAKVVLNLTASNPSDREQVVEVDSQLPRGITTNDILNDGGLSSVYDIGRDVYRVEGELVVPAGESKTIKIALRDIWCIPDKNITELKEHVVSIADLVKGKDRKAKGDKLLGEIDDNLARIKKLEESASIDKTSASEHILAFADIESLWTGVLRKTAELEMVVLSSRKDPKRLMGVPSWIVIPSNQGEWSASCRKAKWRITVKNTSKTETRTIAIHQPLPPALLNDDVIDAGDLRIGANLETGVGLVVSGEATDVLPGETRVFDILINDKWHTYLPRITTLEQDAHKALGNVRRWRIYKSVEERLENGLAVLAEIRAEPAMEILGPEYVAFHKQQVKRIDDVERDILWVSNMLTSGVIGTAFPPPTRNTTWRIIYIILGFLAVVTLVVLTHTVRNCKA